MPTEEPFRKRFLGLRFFRRAKSYVADERTQLVLDATPLCINIIDKEYRNIECNQEAVKLFGMRDKKHYIESFWDLQPEFQPDGKRSVEQMKATIDIAYEEGYHKLEWMHQKPDGEQIPCEVTLVRVKHKGDDMLLAYMRDLREFKRIIGEIENHDYLLKTVNLMAVAMLTMEADEKFEKSLLSGLGMIGRHMNSDRAQIWKNELVGGELCFVHMYEWLSEIGEQKVEVPIGLRIPYSMVPEWKEKFSRGESINGPLAELPEADRRLLNTYDIASIVIIPLFLEERFWGFFSIDDCVSERKFAEDELDILRSASLMLASVVNRHFQTGRMYEVENELREARDAAEAANRTKSIFLANMSHEIRTPMNSITGFTELALDDNIPYKTREYLNKIKDNTDWLLQIINDILDITKIESGKLELENIPFHLHEIFAFCQTAIMPKALEKGIYLHFYAEPSIGRRFLGDPTRLRQVLINLLSNAVKFTRVGMVKVSSSIREIMDNRATIHFEVRDSGIGMTSEQIARIHEPFMQADASTTRRYGGTGLGLSITKSIISSMGGELAVESVPGVGSKFSFDLTFDTIDVQPESPETEPAMNEVEKPVFQGEILICEDSAMNQQVICEHLARVGLSTKIAENGSEGVRLVKERIASGEKQFDLIFMDINMPVMDGLEASSIIRSLQPKIPIVAMTANIMPSEKKLYEMNGLLDCVGKPFTTKELYACLLRYFTPVKHFLTDGKQQAETDQQLSALLRTNFYKENKSRYDEIVKAVEGEDIKLAHRLAHNLKSNAGQIGETSLQEAAASIENSLKEGKSILGTAEMDSLKEKLDKVLGELAPLQNRAPAIMKSPDNVHVVELLDDLEGLLHNRNPECLALLDELRTIPEADELADLVEDFDFKAAIVTLTKLREKWR